MKLRLISAVALFLTSAAVLLAQSASLKPVASKPVPGRYDSLQLAVDPATGALSGSFYDETAAGKFSCGFLLWSDGKLSADGSYRVTTWYPDRELNNHPNGDDEVVVGRLNFPASPTGGPGAGATLQLPRQAHGGCWNVRVDLDQGKEESLPFDSARPAWKQMRIVKVARLNFYSRPEEAAVTRAYVVKSDILAITDRKGDWLQAEFISYRGERGTEHKTTGWVYEAGLLPVTPPVL